MNSRQISLLMAVVMLHSQAFAQTENEVPVPTEPHLQLPGKMTRWTTVAKNAGQPANNTDPKTVNKLDSATYFFSDKIDLIEKKWSNGNKTFAWVFQPYILEEAPYDSNVVEVKEMGRPGVEDFRKASYPGLQWVGKNSFKEVATLDGRACFVYSRPATSARDYPLPPEAGNNSASASSGQETVWVDVVARVPIRHFVEGITYDYRFAAWDGKVLPPPPSVLTLKASLLGTR